MPLPELLSSISVPRREFNPRRRLSVPYMFGSETYAMSITLTERAASEVKKILVEQKYEPGTVLRIGVTGGGCSGFSYSLGLDKTFDEKLDSKSEQHGVTVVMDKKSALFLDGTSVDFHEGVEKRGFTFDNPNAVKTCGCGSSFQA